MRMGPCGQGIQNFIMPAIDELPGSIETSLLRQSNCSAFERYSRSELESALERWVGGAAALAKNHPSEAWREDPMVWLHHPRVAYRQQDATGKAIPV